MEIRSGKRLYSGGMEKTCATEVHLRIIAIGCGKYLYESQTGNTYQVVLHPEGGTCTCPEYLRHVELNDRGAYVSDGYQCKHILTVKSLLKLPCAITRIPIINNTQIKEFIASLPKDAPFKEWGWEEDRMPEGMVQELPDISEIPEELWKLDPQ